MKFPSHEIAVLPLTSLRPAEYNPRTISEPAMRGLRASLERFGNLGLIVWNKRTGNIVSGHQRARALQDAGETETRVVVVDLDDVEEKALNVTLNNPEIGGEFNADLVPILEELRLRFGEGFVDLRLDQLDLPPVGYAPEMEDESGERFVAMYFHVTHEERETALAILKPIAETFKDDSPDRRESLALLQIFNDYAARRRAGDNPPGV